jgi:glycine oxidase
MKRVAVIGAGIIGTVQAAFLQHRGLQVTLYGPDPGPGDPSFAAAGMLAPRSEAEDEPRALLPHAEEARRLYPELLRELIGQGEASLKKTGFREEGTLWVALDRDQQRELEHVHAQLAAIGRAPESLSANRLRSLEPRLGPRAIGGFRVPSDTQVDPRRLRAAVLEAFCKNGGSYSHERIASLQIDAGELRGLTTESGVSETFETGVVCAGVTAARLLAPHGLDPGLRPVKGQLLRLTGEPLLRHVVRTPKVYLIPRADGELLIGATLEEMGDDITPTAGAMLDLLAHAWAVLPDVYEMSFAEISVGLRPAPPDRHPRVGPTEVAGLWLSVGHYRNGILWAPYHGRLLADWIVGQEPADWEAFHRRVARL